jgi:hypothetical protein
MRNKESFTGLAAAILVVTLGIPLTASADTYQTADFHTFPDGVGLTTSAGTLTRSADSVTASLSLSGQDKKSSYTTWWVVWNDPSQCGVACDLEDLGVPGNSVFYATGFVTGTDGTANVLAHLDAGSLRDGIDVLIPGGLDAGNGLAAEIHMIVQSHGKTLEGSVSDQIGHFLGACNPDCEDQIAIAFLP